MKRDCFLCGGSNLLEYYRNTWDIVDSGSHEVAYSLCEGCGMVFASETVGPDVMRDYYERCAVYGNYEGERYTVTEYKKRDLDRIVSKIKYYLPKDVDSVFQVGCSDGYTLMRFKEAGFKETGGIDISKNGHELAKKFFSVETEVAQVEEYEFKKRYGLVVLTHVLEHLYEPQKALEKVAASQTDGDWVFIEVPLFDRVELLPVGYFSFEHLNYFTEETLIDLVCMSGYEPVCVEKIFNDNSGNIYPVINVMAKKGDISDCGLKTANTARIEEQLGRYTAKEKQNWDKALWKIEASLASERETLIWGAGIHSSQLLANTGLASKIAISAFVDSSPTKWGRKISGIRCISPQELDRMDRVNIIISSYASENTIAKYIEESFNKDFNVIKLYDRK